MHGNEPAGRELLLQLADYFCRKYERDRRVQRLVNDTRIHLMPCMNPDGFHTAYDEYNKSVGGLHILTPAGCVSLY